MVDKEKIDVKVLEMKIEQHMLDASFEDGFSKGKARAYIECTLMVAALVIFIYASRV